MCEHAIRNQKLLYFGQEENAVDLSLFGYKFHYKKRKIGNVTLNFEVSCIG